MMSKSNYPRDLFNYYKQDKSSAGKTTKKSKNPSKQPTKRKRNAKSLGYPPIPLFQRNMDNSTIMEFEDIPATPPEDPPKPNKKRVSEAGFKEKSLPEYLPTFSNANLDRLKNQERSAMLSSPSILSSTKKKIRRDPELSFDDKSKKKDSSEKVFDELKNSDAAEKPKSPVKQVSEKVQVEGNNDPPGSPPKKKPKVETYDWTLINPNAIKSLKESSNNFHAVLNELKKAK
jgi:hypothetical protein